MDGGSYVVELVQVASTGEHWLRARHADQPVVFLLARFEDAHEAEVLLERGFEPVGGSFPHTLLLHLVDEGLCDICVPRRADRRVGRRVADQPELPSESAGELVFAAS